MKKFEGKVTLITGGGKGIGFGLATAFAREGSNLVITGRNEARLQDAKVELERKWGVKVLPLVADGADEAAVKAVVAKAHETFGRIDTLINNAQVSKSGLPLVEHTREDLDLAIFSGIYAAFFYMRECFPYLKESKGSVINFASGAGLFGKPGQSSYTAAKEQWKVEYPELFAKTIKDIPLGRFADPVEDIGRTCVFLASEDASFITGETITLQGGSGLRP